MSDSWRASLQQIIQNLIITVLGLLKSGKLRHAEILLDGTAQSVRFGETLRGRSGRPGNINPQEVANSQYLIMGSDTTELELSVESRSFMNRVNDQVRKKTEKHFQRCRRRRRTFYYLVNVHGCNNGISSSHG